MLTSSALQKSPALLFKPPVSSPPGLPPDILRDLAELRKKYPNLDEHRLRNHLVIASGNLAKFYARLGVRAPSHLFTETRYVRPRLDNAQLEHFRAMSEKLEGIFFHLYLDTNGNVTIGIGHNLEGKGNLGLAGTQNTIPFWFSRNHKTPDSPRRKATRDEIAAEWAVVKKLNPNTPAEKQGLSTHLVTDQNTVNRLYYEVMQQWEQQLARDYKRMWQYFPISAKMALLSLAYAKGRPRDWFKYCDALVRRFDFEGASSECHFGGTADSNLQVRGQWQQLLFQRAAADVGFWILPDEPPARNPRVQNA